jgi:hypothetical protein
MNWQRPDYRACFLAFLITCLAFGRAGDASPAAVVNVAGLVIDYGDGSRTYALVPLEDEEVTGLDILDATDLELLTLGSSGWGVAVCAIEAVGCDVAACQARLCQTGDPDSPFWQYVRSPLGEGTTWSFSNQGAGSSKVTSGDVEGWFWSGSRPTTSAPTLEQIAAELNVDLTSLDSTAVVRSVGLVPEGSSPRVSPVAYIASTAILCAVAGAGAFAVHRSKVKQ